MAAEASAVVVVAVASAAAAAAVVAVAVGGANSSGWHLLSLEQWPLRRGRPCSSRRDVVVQSRYKVSASSFSVNPMFGDGPTSRRIFAATNRVMGARMLK